MANLAGAAAVLPLPPAELHLAQLARLLQVQQRQVHRVAERGVWGTHSQRKANNYFLMRREHL